REVGIPGKKSLLQLLERVVAKDSRAAIATLFVGTKPLVHFQLGAIGAQIAIEVPVYRELGRIGPVGASVLGGVAERGPDGLQLVRIVCHIEVAVVSLDSAQIAPIGVLRSGSVRLRLEPAPERFPRHFDPRPFSPATYSQRCRVLHNLWRRCADSRRS